MVEILQMNDAKSKNIVTVLIPTMASAARAEMLRRAVHSIRDSSKDPIDIIVIVNGMRFDETICEWLRAQPDIRFEYVAEPSLPLALLHGRGLVKTEFYSTLDDDDEYLPGSTDLKLEVMRSNQSPDFVVGNYVHSFPGGKNFRYEDMHTIPVDPMLKLFTYNWLSSGNALYRTASIGIEYFSDLHPFAEWTLLAFRLCIDRKTVAIVDEPVFICHGDTPDSLSKSSAYLNSYIPLFNRMLALSPPWKIRLMIRSKRGSGYHDASAFALRDGDRAAAWRNHLRSVFEVSGWRYLLYTRHLVI